MTGIKHRVERLERATANRGGRIFVIKGPDGYDIGQAKSELGIQTNDDDLTIYLRDFGNDRSWPVLL